MKKILEILLPVILSLHCSKSDETVMSRNTYTTNGPRSAGDMLIYSMRSEPTTLNPITATDTYESIINSFIYEALIERDPVTFEWKPLLAHKWEISQDKLKYKFYLRKGIKWHDGREFTAADVLFSFNKIKDPKVDAPALRNYYKDVKKLDVLDEYTVEFTYSKPYFMALEFCGGMPILPAHIFGTGDFNKHPNNRHSVGTGPYVFEKWETLKQIVIKRNTAYWRKERSSYLDKIAFKIISDDTVRLQLLKKGNMDTAELRPIQWVKQTSSSRFNKKFRKLSFYTPYYNYIGWNLRKPYFSDRNVREALTRLLDRTSILKNLLYGLGETTTGPFYIFSKDYDPSVKPYDYDVKKAMELLARAGWKDSNNDGILDKDGVDFKFTFLIANGSTFAEQLATILKENYRKVGIVMEIKKLEWASFIQHIEDRKFDSVSLGWSMGIETDPYQLWHSTQTERGSNFVGFKNARADELIEKARSEFDETKRREMYRELHRIIAFEQPYTFLFCSKSLVAVEKRFQNTKTYNVRPGVDITEWWVPPSLQVWKNVLQ
ncbi:MAG: peptide-binding protein [bacterium]|nr:peptide-binding protein [bacterium]